MTNEAVNWGDAQSSNFEPLSTEAVVAPLEATLSGYEVRSGAKGPYFSFEFTLDGEAAELHGSRKFWDIASMSPGGLWGLKEALIAFGIAPERVGPDSTEAPEPMVQESVGCSVRLKLSPPKAYPKNDGTTGVRNEIDKILGSAYAMP